LIYVLFVSFRLDVKTMVDDTNKVVKSVGREACGSGAGFGLRDVEFEFKSYAERQAAIDRLERDKPLPYEVYTTDRKGK